MAKGTDQQTCSKEAVIEEDHDADEEYSDEKFADEEFSGMESAAALSAKKEAFYKEVDKKIAALLKVQKNANIIPDGLFNEIYNFMLSIQDTYEEVRMTLLRSIPNKVGHKWMKKLDIRTVDTSNVLIFKQAEGEALDACQKVVKYSKCLMLYGTYICLLYTSPSPRDGLLSRMPSSA